MCGLALGGGGYGAIAVCMRVCAAGGDVAG